jgi:hypothetical protein
MDQQLKGFPMGQRLNNTKEKRMNKISRVTLGIAVVFALMAATGVASAAARADGSPAYYLALGDSVAAGYQTPAIPIDRACVHRKLDAQGQRGFACILWRQLQKKDPGIQLASLALAVSPGEDSCSFQSVTNCEGATSRVDGAKGDVPPFDINTTSQLKAAEAFIAAHNVKVISFGIGGNDFLPLLGEAEQPGGLAKAEAQIPTVEKRLASNLTSIVGTLRALAPGAVFLLADQYNPLSGLPASALGPNGAGILKLATRALASFQAGIKLLATGTQSQYVDEYDPFLDNGPTLTWITVSQDIHPNARGYLLLAKANWASYLDATSPLKTLLKLNHKVKPGKLLALHIKTLPYGVVTSTIAYTAEGWAGTATRTDTASIDGTLTQGWHVPAHAKGPATVRSCSALNGKSACQSAKFIIA